MSEQETLADGSEVPPRVACRGCAMLLVGIISMTVVAVGERTGELDRFRSWVAQTDIVGLHAQSHTQEPNRADASQQLAITNPGGIGR